MDLLTINYQLGRGWFPDIDKAFNSKDTLIIVFGASAYDQNELPIKELRKALPDSQLVGCSTAGEIFHTEISDNTLTAAIIKFKQTKVKTCAVSLSDAAMSFDAGERMGETLATNGLQGVLLFSDGLNVNGSDLISGLKSKISDDVTIAGGLAGDGDRFKQTWTIHNDDLTDNAVVACGLYGDKINLSCGSQGGWDRFGPERVITKSELNVLYTIDDKPALELYKEYLGERAAGLPATALLFPLAISHPSSGTKDYIVRTILGVDEATQSLTFAGDIPDGWTAQLMKANFDRLIEGAYSAGEMAHSNMQEHSGAILALAISCVGRKLVLGERTEEIEATLEALPKHAQQIGFYSYGEISPTGVKNCDLHNQTMTITTLFEDE